MTAKSPETTSPEGELATPSGPKQEPTPQLLFRIVPQAHVVNGVPTFEAFKLRVPGDRGLLSVDLQSLTSAPAAYAHRAKAFAAANKKPPAGVWAVSVEECSTRSTSLGAYSDPREGNPAHGGIDFRELAADSQKALRRLLEKELLDCALERKCVYPLDGDAAATTIARGAAAEPSDGGAIAPPKEPEKAARAPSQAPEPTAQVKKRAPPPSTT